MENPTYPRVCPECHVPYCTEEAFWKHFMGSKTGTYCLSYDDKKARGWYYGACGWQTWEERHAPFWSPDRDTWCSSIFDPVDVFNHMFPEPKIKLPWSKRVLQWLTKPEGE